MQKYKGRACCQLNCAKVQRSCMLPTQLCKSTKVLHAANSTVQKYKGRASCQLNCAKVQRSCMLPSQLCKSTKVVGYSPLNQVQTRDLCRSSGSKGQRSWKCKVHYNYYNNIIDYNAHGYYNYYNHYYSITLSTSPFQDLRSSTKLSPARPHPLCCLYKSGKPGLNVTV